MNIKTENPEFRVLQQGEEEHNVIVNDDWNFLRLNKYISFLLRKSSRPLDKLQNDLNCKMIYLDCNQFWIKVSLSQRFIWLYYLFVNLLNG